MSIPLPGRVVRLMVGANPSLRFEKGADSLAWQGDKKAKARKALFVTSFVDGFNAPATDRTSEYQAFVERRRLAIAAVGGCFLDLTLASRLAIGLGLAHPSDIGFLLDRLTACPYIPGSSVKGLLRHAARLVSSGELPVDGTGLAAQPCGFWTDERIGNVFGRDVAAESGPARGCVVFFDAFPLKIPKLEADVLTPHFQAYYKEPTEPPGDWDDPIPVTFVTVAPGEPPEERFRFAFAGRGGALDPELLSHIEALSIAALDWLGAGAKTAAGYGFFSTAAPEERARSLVVVAREMVAQPPDPPPPTPSPRQSESIWKDSRVERLGGSIVVFRSRQKAECAAALAPEDIVRALRAKKTVRASIRVSPGVGAAFRIAGFDDVEIS